jgi:hypothetical protein
MSVTVILNGFKRKDQLSEQLEAVRNQSVDVDNIMLWYNHPDDDEMINYDVMAEIPTAMSNVNLGVWARFAYAFNAPTKYVCVFDDDTIPGRKWIENCLNTMKTHRGLLGTVGLLYTLPMKANEKSSYYEHYIRFGWNHNNTRVQQVDLVGHSWFFERAWLSHMWRELPDPKYSTCGEDMHFSYMLQKYANINTYVPSHPASDREMWGSLKGSEYGGIHSLWTEGPPNQRSLVDDFFREQRNKGWKLVKDV